MVMAAEAVAAVTVAEAAAQGEPRQAGPTPGSTTCHRTRAIPIHCRHPHANVSGLVQAAERGIRMEQRVTPSQQRVVVLRQERHLLP